MIRERLYWVKRRLSMWGRSALYAVMPNWLVREAMMYATRYIEGNEEVPSVKFMTVFERVCKEGK